MVFASGHQAMAESSTQLSLPRDGNDKNDAGHGDSRMVKKIFSPGRNVKQGTRHRLLGRFAGFALWARG